MRLPAGYVSRPATWEDLDSVVALFRACDLADSAVEDPVREHLADDWRQSGPELDRDTVLAFASDGSPAGYANVFGMNPELSVEAFGRVHPGHRGRGIGVSLVAWTEARAREVVPDGVASRLRNSVPATDGAAERLLVGRGYERVRIFWHMERDLAAVVEEFAAPEGIHIRSYRPDADVEALYRAIEEAFVDHWGYEPNSWDRHVEEMARLDPGLVGLAVDGEEVVGAVLAKTVQGGAWIDVVAVRRPWRGRGIARALLSRSFEDLAARGAGSVTLNVDSASPTGATRLYESVGMGVRRAWNVFERPLGAT